jgi:hypothetical protein
MYFQYAFLLSDFYKNEFIPDPLESSSVIVPVAKPLWEKKAYYFEKFYTASTTFCFGFFQAYMEWENWQSSTIRDSLSLFFFLPNYAKKAGAYLLVSDLYTGKGQEEMDATEQLLELQGITPLSKNYTVENEHIAKLNKYYYYNTDLIEAFSKASASIDFSVLFKKLVAENGIDKQIILPIKDEVEFKKMANVIKDFEQWIPANEKTYANLLSVVKKTNEAYLKLKVENDKLRFSLNNYSDYLKALRKIASRYVDDYHRSSQQQPLSPGAFNANSVQQELNSLRTSREEILQWYTKEYEVLPLWYKRFGHVIKIAMGKKKINEYLHRSKKN